LGKVKIKFNSVKEQVDAYLYEFKFGQVHLDSYTLDIKLYDKKGKK